MFSTLRSGWLSAALAIFFAISVLGQTEPRMIVVWDPIEDPSRVVGKYRIETTVGTLPYALAKECAATENLGCTVTGIDGTITYKVRVAGVDAQSGQVGEFSDPVSFLFASIQPLSPTSLTQASASSSQPGKIAKKLSWTAVTKYRTGPLIPASKPIQYLIYQAMTGPAVVIATSNSNSFTVQGLTKNKTYQFYVTCVVDGVESFASPAIRLNT